MQFALNSRQCQDLSISTQREWLLSNGIGGFAMGTASEVATRRYHGLLVAAVRPPATRMVLLAGLECSVHIDNKEFGLSCNQYPGAIFPQGYQYLSEFSTGRFARWKFKGDSFEVWRTVSVHQGDNAVTIRYENKGHAAISLRLRPLVCHKPYHENFYESASYPEHLSFFSDSTLIRHGGISLHLSHKGAFRNPVQGWYYRFEHQVEIDRGLPSRDDLYCPCELVYSLKPGQGVSLVASTRPSPKPIQIKEPEVTICSGEPPRTDQDLLEALKQAASQFLVKTKDRTSIIAGYPWFTDWGRDTMISIPGTCIKTGHIAEARAILRDFAKQMKQGIIPNRFVESGEQPQYNTVDATLWYVNAAYEALSAEWEKEFAVQLSKTFYRMFDWHMKGTFHGIKVDEADGLLTQGEEGTQLTWMDAKIGDWVVTPRHGKPVEINGLWINALRIMEWLSDKLADPLKDTYRQAAEKAEGSFESKFWLDKYGFYLDTADPDDASLRPNQVIAMSLQFSPCRKDHALRALDRIDQELLTPRGLRSLSPNDPNYKGRYRGPLPTLDAAYHEGTVWPWLLGPYLSACKRYRGSIPDREQWTARFWEMLAEDGLGGIAEVYDGDEPRAPGGCPWQAWSVAEILRILDEN